MTVIKRKRSPRSKDGLVLSIENLFEDGGGLIGVETFGTCVVRFSSPHNSSETKRL